MFSIKHLLSNKGAHKDNENKETVAQQILMYSQHHQALLNSRQSSATNVRGSEDKQNEDVMNFEEPLGENPQSGIQEDADDTLNPNNEDNTLNPKFGEEID